MVKARETNLEEILEGKRQYQVPLYQRRYSWKAKQIDQLWEDILELSEVRRSEPAATHFIGSLVLALSPDNHAAVGMTRLLVVDGQQRLTTLTVLLAALRDHLAETEGGDHRARIDEQHLINRYEPHQPPKVMPTQADRAAYLDVIRALPQAGGDDPVGSAYRSFRAKLAAADDLDDPHDIAAIEQAVLRGLALVAVTAEPGDNAHRIFESLNNTGLRLTQADLLKNYLFMRLGERAEQVYDSVWLPLEKKLTTDELELLFWLDLVQTDEKAKQSDTFVGQQRRLEKLASAAEVEAEVVRIAGLGDVLATILDPTREPEAALRQRLERIRAWGSTTAYPIVMHLLTRRAEGTATVAEVCQALLHLESYFVRRIVIGRATAGINRALLQAVAPVSEGERVDVALRDYLSTGRKHYATDEQVREAVQSVPFYWQGRASQKKLILQWIEQGLRPKETVDPSGLTIEHVLPQSLTGQAHADFDACLPEGADLALEHERLVHTLGNLTLSGYNPELSNHPFGKKRPMLDASGLAMNREIAQRDVWGPAEIQARGSVMAARIIAAWPGPNEALLGARDAESELGASVASLLAVIPAGRWTSYGEVAVVAGSHPVPVGAAIAAQPMANAWRVLNVEGQVSDQFRWHDPNRADDPRDVLVNEGVSFTANGRAHLDDFLDASELAALAGLDVEPSQLARRRRRLARRANTDPEALGMQQLAFWEHLRAFGQSNSTHADFQRKAGRRHWYGVKNLGLGSGVNLMINSMDKRVEVDLHIDDAKFLFHALAEQRDEIEQELGYGVDWRELPGKKASRVVKSHGGDFTDPEQASELIAWLVSVADDFVRVFGAYVGQEASRDLAVVPWTSDDMQRLAKDAGDAMRVVLDTLAEQPGRRWTNDQFIAQGLTSHAPAALGALTMKMKGPFRRSNSPVDYQEIGGVWHWSMGAELAELWRAARAES